MSFPTRSFARLWLFVPLGALGLLFFTNGLRIRHVERVSNLVGVAPATDAASLTGYAGGSRQLVVPEHNVASFQWITQTQLAWAEHRWRLQHVDYDNAPAGREVKNSALYRWWFEAVARLDYWISDRSPGAAVEQAALFADPLLHGLLLLLTALFVARQFGALAAATFALGWALIFPLAGAFLPGQPDDFGLAQGLALWSVLLLLAAFGKPKRIQQRWLAGAGAVAGLGLWVNLYVQLPIVGGIVLGALLAAVVSRYRWNPQRATLSNPASNTATEPEKSSATIERMPAAAPDRPTSESPLLALEPSAWRAWALGGAVATLIAYFIQYFPAHFFSADLKTIHPLFAVAWAGLGELLRRAVMLLHGGVTPWTRWNRVGFIAAAGAVLVIPVNALWHWPVIFFGEDPLAPRLSNLPGSGVAPNLFVWLSQAGPMAIAATLLPLLLLAPTLWILVRRQAGPARAAALATASGPVIVALVVAVFHLRWWAVLDGMLLALFVAGVAVLRDAGTREPRRLVWVGCLLLSLVPAIVVGWPGATSRDHDSVTLPEAVSLVERDLGQWLAGRGEPGRTVVLASPNLTASLCYYASMRGLATPYRENRDGFFGSARIASATLPDEALLLAQQRGVTHIVVASWDPYLDQYARLGADRSEQSLIGLLHRWLPPRWLRPIPYRLPQIAGLEGHSVTVFEIVEVQDNATALGRLAEYFVEMGMLDEAYRVSATLARSFGNDFGAMIARAVTAHAVQENTAFDAVIAELLPQLSAGVDRSLPWDRQVSLAIVLAQAKRFDQARSQVRQCLAELDASRLRSLTPASLYQLHVLIQAFRLTIEDPALRDLAFQLLPAETRAAMGAR